MWIVTGALTLASPRAEALADWATSLEVEPGERAVELRDETLDLGGVRLSLDDVVATPIWSGTGDERIAVGLSFRGTAHAVLDVAPPDRSWTANLLHRSGREADARQVAEQGHHRVPVKGGSVVGAHPAIHALVADASPTERPDGLATLARLDQLRLASGWRGRILTDRVGVEALGWRAEGTWTLVDLDTGEPLGPLHDGWLTRVSDPVAGESSGWRDVVYATRRTGDRLSHTRLYGTPWKGASSAPIARPVRADVGVRAQPEDGRGLVHVGIAADVRVRASGATLRGTLLRIPHGEALRGAFRIERLDHPWVDLGNGLLLVLPEEPVPAGETLDISLAWRDAWWLTLGDDGATTGLRHPLPELVPGGHGNPWPFRLAISVPKESGLSAVASGRTERSWTEEGDRWTLTTSEGPARWVAVAVGQWHTAQRSGTPSVEVHRLSRHTDGYAEMASEIAQHYEAHYGAWPHASLKVVEEPPTLIAGAWWASHALVAIRSVWSPWTRASPDWVASGLAHEMAHQYWGQVVVPADDRVHWYLEGMAERARCQWARVTERETCDAWLDRTRRKLERGGHASPTRATGYAVRVLTLRMLEHRIGPEAFARGTRDLLELGQPITQEDVRDAYSQAAGTDLSAWWKSSVDGGWIPTLTARWRRDGGAVVGRVESDLPYGRIDVPVRVTRRGEVLAETWVGVEDGRGQLRFEKLGPGPIRVHVDPDHRVLARKRRSRRGR